MNSGFIINIIECESKLDTRGRINISTAKNELLLLSSTLDSLKKQVLTKPDLPRYPAKKKNPQENYRPKSLTDKDSKYSVKYYQNECNKTYKKECAL